MLPTAASIAAENKVRLPYVLEALESRRMWTVVPFDATAGLPIAGPVATGLVLPAYASGPDLMNITLNGQYDYTPTAVQQADGTYTLYTTMVPQQAGTGELAITFRNEQSGGWDLLEVGTATVKANHFSAVVPDNTFNNVLPGTKWTTPVTTMATSPLTQALDQYDVQITWFGETKTGHLQREADGNVGVYVDDGYLPAAGGFSPVETRIRLKSAAADAPAVGVASAYFDSNGGLGIGTFHAVLNEDKTELKILLPNTPPLNTFNHFTPVADVTDWPTTFKVDVLWQKGDDNLSHSAGTVVKESDGTHSVRVAWPTFFTDGGMIRITETVNRPAIGIAPAATFDVEYVGSFAGGGDPIEQAGATPAEPVPVDPPIDPVVNPRPPTEAPTPDDISPLPTGGEIVIIDTAAPGIVPTAVNPTDPIDSADAGDPTTPPAPPTIAPPAAPLFAVAPPVAKDAVPDQVAISILAIGEDTLFGESSDDVLSGVLA